MFVTFSTIQTGVSGFLGFAGSLTKPCEPKDLPRPVIAPTTTTMTTMLPLRRRRLALAAPALLLLALSAVSAFRLPLPSSKVGALIGMGAGFQT